MLGRWITAARTAIQLKNYRIKHKLLLTYPLLITLSIFVVSLFAVQIAMNLLEQKAITYSQSTSKQISYNTDNQQKQIDRDSLSFLQNEQVNRFFTGENAADRTNYMLRAAVENVLTQFLIAHPNLESVSVINKYREVISLASDLPAAAVPSYSEAARQGDGKMVWLPTVMSPQGNLVIPLVRQLNDLNTLKPNGTLVMNFRESSIGQLIDDQDLNLTGDIFVVGGDGTVLSARQIEAIGEQMASSVWKRMHGKQGYFFDRTEGDYFYSYYQSDYTNWQYLYRIPRSQLFEGIAVVRNWVLLFAALFAAATVYSARVIAGNISKPIIHVVKEMKNIEMNQLNVNLQYEGKDELAVLTQSFNRMTEKVRQLMKKESDLQQLRHELEIRALQAEINPHFLYNTLDAINWIGRMNNVPQICDMTTKLADIMRYNIDKRRDLVTLADEIVHIRKYLGIQQIRLADKLTVFIDVPESAGDMPVPKMTLQPIVENAIVHGLRNKIGTGVIRIIGEVREQSVRLRIEDNGSGMEPAQAESLLEPQEQRQKGGIGFYNVNQRIRLLFGDAYGLEVQSVVGRGTRVTVTIPIVRGA